MKHIEVEKIPPCYGITLTKEQLVHIIQYYLVDNDIRLGGKVLTSYATGTGGYYIKLEEETTREPH